MLAAATTDAAMTASALMITFQRRTGIRRPLDCPSRAVSRAAVEALPLASFGNDVASNEQIDGPWQQDKIYEKAEASGGAYRGRLRASRRRQALGRAARLGDGEHDDRGGKRSGSGRGRSINTAPARKGGRPAAPPRPRGRGKLVRHQPGRPREPELASASASPPCRGA
jgi:hypothetical protein